MSIDDRKLKCALCRAAFIFLVGELSNFKDMGFRHDPQHCQGCKWQPDVGHGSRK